MKVIVTGSTGMVGEGVAHECLLDPTITEVLLISRRSGGMKHAKIKELILPDLNDLASQAEKLRGYDACFFCAGVTSIGKNEAEFTALTYTLTMNVARVLSSLNPQMVFCYVSGAGTDSSEKGKLMWARVKGKTENDLMKLPFRKVYAFRPGIMLPTPGLKNTLRPYKYFGWIFKIIHRLAPASANTLAEVGRAMINLVRHDYSKQVIGIKDILILAKQH